MNPERGQWRFVNLTRGQGEILIQSISSAVELLVEVSREGMGEVIYFQNSKEGSVSCTAGCGLSTLCFDPHYVPTAHSLAGSKRAVPQAPAPLERFYFVDETATISSIDSEEVLPILDVVRGVIFILENHDYPSFLEWKPGC